jgi:hypothetical protein
MRTLDPNLASAHLNPRRQTAFVTLIRMAGNANTLKWSISGDQIYFENTFKGNAGWYGVGFNKNSNMEYADYNLVFPSGHSTLNFPVVLPDYRPSTVPGNFTGVRDLYKWDAGDS